jgi:hypothetical protein
MRWTAQADFSFFCPRSVGFLFQICQYMPLGSRIPCRHGKWWDRWIFFLEIGKVRYIKKNISGWWFQPSWNMRVNGKDDIPYIMENKTCLKPSSRDIITESKCIYICGMGFINRQTWSRGRFIIIRHHNAGVGYHGIPWPNFETLHLLLAGSGNIPPSKLAKD